MKKQAIMIMAHNNLEILKLLLDQLDSEYFDLFLHVDIKCQIEYKDIKDCVKISKLYFFKELNIKWGGITIAQGQYYLMNRVVETGYDYEFVHLISGVDFPIKTNEEIYNFFHQNVGKEFIHYQNEEFPKHKYSWVKYYRFFPKNYRKHKFIRGMEVLSQKIQKIFGVNRIKNNEYKYMTGANWVSISLDLVKYLLSKEVEFNKKFKYTHFPEELFVQTYVYNSDFKDKLYSKKYDDNHDNCMRYIDWKRGNPYTFKIEDLDLLLNSKCMFARKFDGKYIDVVKELHKRLKK